MAYLSFISSVLALLLSITVAWLTLFRRGKLKMTKPVFVAFCYDLGKDNQPIAKIFIRALLYSTGKRGHVMENMYLIVQNSERAEIFNVWGHGDEKLSRGSGLFVAESGISTNHHFNPLSETSDFVYLPGNYKIQIFATLPGCSTPIQVHVLSLEIGDNQLLTTLSPETSIWFEWQPNKMNYYAHIETKRKIL